MIPVAAGKKMAKAATGLASGKWPSRWGLCRVGARSRPARAESRARPTTPSMTAWALKARPAERHATRATPAKAMAATTPGRWLGKR